MDAAALRALLPPRAEDLRLEVEDSAPPHPQVGGHTETLRLPARAGAPVVLRAGAVSESHAAQLAETIVAFVEGRREEDDAAAEAMRHERSLFDAHARFLREREVPPGWYRRGEPLGPGLWVVDLDVFLEVVLLAAEWEALLGQTLSLVIDDEPLEFELPADADFEACWTLPGTGLFEPDAGVRLEELGPDDDVPGRFGDLHVVPIVL